MPPHQRDYAWTEEEWADLRNDILDLLREQPDGRHYMGVPVMRGRSDRELTITDGRQKKSPLAPAHPDPSG